LKAGGSTTVLKTSMGIIRAGIWYHIAATYDGSRMRIYKDGVEVVSTAKSGIVDTNPDILAAIGNQSAAAGGGWPFDGLLDDVRIYNRALSATEIAVIANPVTTGLSGNPVQKTPIKYELDQNYPNPFNPFTTISFSLPRTERVVLIIYDLLGNQVANLVNATLPVGKYSIQWFPQGLSNGVYYYRIESGDFMQTKKMFLVK
jgi:hypothetical protein